MNPMVTATARSRRTRTLAAVALGAALALTASVGAAPASARTAPPPVRAARPAVGKARGEVIFHSPSKNIYCVIFKYQGKASGRCDIKQRAWPAPHRPHSCHLDYGNGAEVGPHGKGHYTCAGDTVIAAHHKALPYGQSIKLGAVKCTSRRTGMTCHNVKTDHGFTISREAVDFF